MAQQRPYRLLLNRFLRWFRQSFAFLWLVVAAGYLMASAGQAVYHNYQSQQDTQALKNQLLQSEQEQQRLNSLLVYYQTDSYKEKQLRQDMLLARPDEKVYALPESNKAISIEDEVKQESQALPQSTSVERRSNWQQWVDYLLNKG